MTAGNRRLFSPLASRLSDYGELAPYPLAPHTHIPASYASYAHYSLLLNILLHDRYTQHGARVTVLESRRRGESAGPQASPPRRAHVSINTYY